MNWNYQVHLRYLLGLQELLVQYRALLAQGVQHKMMILNVMETVQEYLVYEAMG